MLKISSVQQVRIGGLQTRMLNRGRHFYAIQPGFDGAPPRRCQYISGDPSADEACKCGYPAVSGSAYCAHHHRRCWVPERDHPYLPVTDFTSGQWNNPTRHAPPAQTATTPLVYAERLRPQDLPAMDDLAAAAQAAGMIVDFVHLLAAGTLFGCRDGDGRLMALLPLLPCQTGPWRLGPLLVRPEADSEEHGAALVGAALAAAGDRPLTAVADPRFGRWFHQFGFRKTDGICRCRRQARGPAEGLGEASGDSLNPAHLHLLQMLDADAWRGDRGAVLAALWNRRSTAVLQATNEGQTAGYGIMRPLVDGQWIGPVVASTATAAAAIVVGLTGQSGGDAVSLWVNASRRDLRRQLAAQGFRTIELLDVLVRRPQPAEQEDGARLQILADLAFG